MSHKNTQIDAEDLLSRPGFALLDVRAEVEFADGHIPGSHNIPILNNQERHSVGLAYKTEGPAAAVALGHALVDPQRNFRVEAWRAFLTPQIFPVLTCFRGGMRSEIAQRWLSESGLEATRVEGGYKALRRILFRQWESPLQGFVVTGLTGSNKTGFVRSLGVPRSLDLEGYAVHRGSAFGGLFQPSPQPSQQSFENLLALALFQSRSAGPRDFLMEDESRLIGRCVIPTPFFERMRFLPRIFLEATDEERADHIFNEYVGAPLLSRPAPQVMGELIVAVRGLRNRMGGLTTDEVEAGIRRAFAVTGEDSRVLHREWITKILQEYYDRLYSHAMSRVEGAPVFRGRTEECQQWLRENSDLFLGQGK